MKLATYLRYLSRSLIAMTTLLIMSESFEKPDNRKCSYLCTQLPACISSTFDPSRLSCSLVSGTSPRTIRRVMQMINKLRTTSTGKTFHFIFCKHSQIKGIQPTGLGRFLLVLPHMSVESSPLHQAYQLSLTTLSKSLNTQLDSRQIAAMVFVTPLKTLILSKNLYFKRILSINFQTGVSLEVAKYAPFAFGVDNERKMIFFVKQNQHLKSSQLCKYFLLSKNLLRIKTYFKTFSHAIAVDSKVSLLYCSYEKFIVALTYKGVIKLSFHIDLKTNVLSLDTSRTILYFSFNNKLKSVNLKNRMQNTEATLNAEPRRLVTVGHHVYASYWEKTIVSVVKFAKKGTNSRKNLVLTSLGNKGLEICLIE